MRIFIQRIKIVLTSSRFKSFYWRTSMMVLAVLIGQLISFIPTLQLNETATVILGLILGEISKALNKSAR